MVADVGGLSGEEPDLALLGEDEAPSTDLWGSSSLDVSCLTIVHQKQVPTDDNKSEVLSDRPNESRDSR
ncbi:hypothetical protein ACP4OV_027328 [Aristida adscensionis]